MSIMRKSLELSIAGSASAGFIYAYRILAARAFGQEAYGLLSVMLAILNMTVLVFMSSAPAAIAKFVADGRNAKEIYRSALWLFPRIGIGLGVLLVLATPLIEAQFGLGGLFRYLGIIALSFPVIMLVAVDRGWLQGTKRMREFGKSQVIEQAGKFAFLVVSIYLGYSIGGALLAGLAGGVIALAYTRRRVRIENGDKRGARGLMHYFIPISMTRIIDGFIMNLDTILLTFWVGLGVIGLYNAAGPIARIPLIAFMAISAVVLPEVSGDHSKAREHLKNALKFAFILILPGIVLIGAFPGFFIGVFFGSEYIGAAPALRILLASSFFIGLYKIFASALQGLGKPYTAAWIFLVVLGFDIIANIILIPQYSIIGAACANLASGVLAAGLAGIMIVRELK